MDPLKEAFFKIKEEIANLRNEINEINTKLNKIETNSKYNPKNTQTTPTHNNPTNFNQTNNSTHTPTHNNTIQALYTDKTDSSIGNKGVQTNTYTNIYTNQHKPNLPNFDFKEVNNILESLDNAKKGIRLKFKRLTSQEMLVFSILYTLEEQKCKEITYRIIATQLSLSESSIRDYINKLINKGIPIIKTRKNNKTIILKISQDLKNIATLTTIQGLREL